MAEVIGGGTLQRAIEEKVVPTPDLLGYQAWISWRAGDGLRPTQRKSGHGTTSAQEAELWRETMARIYGEDWRRLLEDAELMRAEAAEEAAMQEREQRMRESIRRRLAAEATTASLDMDDELLRDARDLEMEEARRAGRDAARSDAGSSEAPPSPRTLRALALAPIDVTVDTYATYEEKFKRYAGALEASGNPLTMKEIQRTVLRAAYSSQVGQELTKEAKLEFIKKTIGGLLTEDNPDREMVEEALSILKDMLERLGGKFSSAGYKLFSSPSKSEEEERGRANYPSMGEDASRAGPS